MTQANPNYKSDNNPYANPAPQPMPQSQPQHSTQNASQQQPPLPGGMDVSGMDVMQPSSSFFDPMVHTMQWSDLYNAGLAYDLELLRDPDPLSPLEQFVLLLFICMIS